MSPVAAASAAAAPHVDIVCACALSGALTLSLTLTHSLSHPPPSRIFAWVFRCECWGCTCQGASDSFGIAHGNKGSMEGVPPDVQTYWIDNRCRTAPERYGGTMIRLKKHPFDKSVCPMIRAS